MVYMMSQWVASSEMLTVDMEMIYLLEIQGEKSAPLKLGYVDLQYLCKIGKSRGPICTWYTYNYVGW